MRVIVTILICFCFLQAEVSKEFFQGVRKSQQLLESGNTNQAIKEAKEVQKIAKNDEEKIYILKFLANAYMAKEDYGKSIKYLLDASSIKGIDKGDIYKNLSVCYYYQKSYKQSLSYGKKYLALNRYDKNIYKLMYIISMKFKNYKDAVKFYAKLYEKQKKDESYYVGLASLYIEAKQYKEALTLLNFAHKKALLKSKNGTSMYLYALGQNNLFEKAVLVVKENREFFSDYKDRLLNLYMRAKDYNNVVRLINQSKNISDKDRFLLARIYFKNQDIRKSISILKMIKFSKDSKLQGDAMILQAYNYYYLKEEKNLTKALKKALKNRYVKKQARRMLDHLNGI